MQKKQLQKCIWLALFLISIFFISVCRSNQENISLFPLTHYSQNIADWIKPSDNNYDKPLMEESLQQKRFDGFYQHYYGANSPWDAAHVSQILQAQTPDNLSSAEHSLIVFFSNQNKSNDQIGYGENFQPYTQEWIDTITHNINFSQFDNLKYDPNNQAIAIDNLHARALPTEDVHFYSHQLPGEGYPFDNLQMSALWIGTPVYILGYTLDRAWAMVITPDYIAWVKSNGLARTNANFINTWQLAAKKQLVAITHTKTSLVDEQGVFRSLAYVGSFFPADSITHDYKLMIPIADNKQQAVISYALVSADEATRMPLPLTPHHFTYLMSTLIGRPYGWGNMYFYNDCSAELKSLFTPFGIWLPRHSSDQIKMGRVADMSNSSPEQRLNYLMEHGQRFMTLIYIGGHVVLYIGNHPNPNTKDHALMAMTYQNMWGIHPKSENGRAVIGKSVLFPLLLEYPEDTNLTTQVAKKYFQVSFLLDEPVNYLKMIQQVDLKYLMYP